MNREKLLIKISLFVVLLALGIVLSISFGERGALEGEHPEFVRKAGAYQVGNRLVLHVKSYVRHSGIRTGISSFTTASLSLPSPGVAGVNLFLTGGLHPRNFNMGNIDPAAPGWFVYIENIDHFWIFNGDERSPVYKEVIMHSDQGLVARNFSKEFYLNPPPRKYIEALPPVLREKWESKMGAP